MGGWKDLKIPWVRRLLITGCLVAAFQQMTGINSILQDADTDRAGFSTNAALIANVFNGVVSVIGSAICLFWLMDRWPRRKALLIGGYIATTTCHVLIVISSFLMPPGLGRAYVILFFTALFVFCMQTTLNIPTWVVLSEMFPLDMRGLGMGISVLVLWVTNAIIAFVFPILVEVVQIQVPSWSSSSSA